MLRFPFPRFTSSRFALRMAGAVGVALLLACGSFLSQVRTAHASGCSWNGPTMFVHTATSTNTFGDYTVLTEDNECSYAWIYATANWNPGGVYHGFDNHPIGVEFNESYAWTIINEDGAPMPIGASFNVYIISPMSHDPNPYTNVQVNKSSSYISFINDPMLNHNPSAILMVTQDLNPGSSQYNPIVNPHEIGIWYDSWLGEWTIYNEDKSPIPNGATFNYMLLPQSGLFPDGFTQVATSSNTSGDSTCINNILTNGNPNAIIFIVHEYSGYFTDSSAVWYNPSMSEWCIFDGSFYNMPQGATFAVAAPSGTLA
jgi:hypothetical protein